MPVEANYIGHANIRTIYGDDGEALGHEVNLRHANDPNIDRTIDTFDTQGKQIGRRHEYLDDADKQIVAQNAASQEVEQRNKERDETEKREAEWRAMSLLQKFDYLKAAYPTAGIFQPRDTLSNSWQANRSLAQRHWDAGEITEQTLESWRNYLEDQAKKRS
jgi:hypothetical protein